MRVAVAEAPGTLTGTSFTVARSPPGVSSTSVDRRDAAHPGTSAGGSTGATGARRGSGTTSRRPLTCWTVGVTGPGRVRESPAGGPGSEAEAAIAYARTNAASRPATNAHARGASAPLVHSRDADRASMGLILRARTPRDNGLA